MTIEELYDFACDNDVLKYDIAVPFGPCYRRTSNGFLFEAAIDKDRKCVIVGETQEEYNEKEEKE